MRGKTSDEKRSTVDDFLKKPENTERVIAFGLTTD